MIERLQEETGFDISNIDDVVWIINECVKSTAVETRIQSIKEELEFLEKVFIWSPNAENRIKKLKSEIKQLEKEE